MFLFFADFNSEELPRKTPKCVLCKNHNQTENKKGHKCPYKNCDCNLCDFRRRSRKIMKLQLALWRFIDTKIDKQEQEKLNTRQFCGKCKNHLELKVKRGHNKSDCKYENCTCSYCKLTDYRREIMKIAQRLQRSDTTVDGGPFQQSMMADANVNRDVKPQQNINNNQKQRNNEQLKNLEQYHKNFEEVKMSLISKNFYKEDDEDEYGDWNEDEEIVDGDADSKGDNFGEIDQITPSKNKALKTREESSPNHLQLDSYSEEIEDKKSIFHSQLQPSRERKFLIDRTQFNLLHPTQLAIKWYVRKKLLTH